MRARLGGEKTSPFEKLPGSELDALSSSPSCSTALGCRCLFKALLCHCTREDRQGIHGSLGLAPVPPAACQGHSPPEGYFPGALSHLSGASPPHIWLSEAFVLQEYSFYFLILLGGKNQPNQTKTPTLA